MTPQKLLCAWLLIAGALALPALASPVSTPTLARTVGAIATAEVAELARLDAAMAAAVDQAEILRLQRCANHVKLASRLALHEAQLATERDPDLRSRLMQLAQSLRDQLQKQKEDLPQDYRYNPLAAFATEVPKCAE